MSASNAKNMLTFDLLYYFLRASVSLKTRFLLALSA
jgi:hypothetical protein